jgi:RNA polymerase sigma factor (sigma-70 family)
MRTEITDTEIISLVLNGQPSAYSMLVDQYRNFVFTLVLRYVKTREDAEEVAQDVFVKAYRSLADFKGQSKFSTWLYTIATTTSISFLRKKKPELHSLDDEKLQHLSERIEGGLTANQVEQKSRAGMVTEAIRLLNTDDAQVLTLFYKGEQSLEEIAQLMNKEPNAVKVQLHRARTRLKEKMQKHFSQEVKDIY